MRRFFAPTRGLVFNIGGGRAPPLSASESICRPPISNPKAATTTACPASWKHVPARYLVTAFLSFNRGLGRRKVDVVSISIPRSKARVMRHFQERMAYGLFVSDVGIGLGAARARMPGGPFHELGRLCDIPHIRPVVAER